MEFIVNLLFQLGYVQEGAVSLHIVVREYLCRGVNLGGSHGAVGKGRRGNIEPQTGDNRERGGEK